MWIAWGLILVVGLYLANIPTKWRFRKIPGPLGLPVMGDILPIMKLGSPTYFRMLKKRFGPVFKVWLGSRPIVVVSDPKLGRSLMFKNHNRQRFPGDINATGREAEIQGASLVFARDNKWKTFRDAWLPAFSTGSLSGYLPLMDDCAQQLCHSVLDVAAASGQVVDIWRELGRMTLQVVGSTAYGVDFHTMEGEEGAGPAGGAGSQLVQACQDIFELSRLRSSSIYSKVATALPELRTVLAFFARRFPDTPLVRLSQARSVIRKQCMALIDDWKATHGSEKVDSDRLAPLGQAQDETPNAGRGVASGVPAVKPGSFLGLILAARDRATGEKLTDAEIMAQADTFLLAGYETTANALAYTIYCLCCNEEAEEKLIKEVDALGRDEPLTMESLEKLIFTEACFQEALRLYPPAAATSREAKDDMMLGDLRVPRGTTVAVSVMEIHHNAEFWPKPDLFRPERYLEVTSEYHPRSPHAHLPFGAGSRMCIGSRFAIQEAKICLVRLYQKYRFKLEAGQVPLQTVNGITLAPKHGVRVTVHVRE